MCFGICAGANTVRTVLRTSSSGVARSVKRKREAAMPRNDRANRPVSNRGTKGRGHVMTKLLATADGQLIYGIGAQHVRRIPVTTGVVAIWIVEVLPIVS